MEVEATYLGGWRQSGVLAGACLYALEHNLPNLILDHQAAEKLADALRKRGYEVETPETNMVWVHLPMTCTELSAKLAVKGLRVFGGEGKLCRLVIHHQNRDHIQLLIDAL
jgi:threonine aldolase